MPKAQYKCLRCEFEYEGPPGPTQCPVCDHLYIKWLNYEEHWADLDIKEIKEGCL